MAILTECDLEQLFNDHLSDDLPVRRRMSVLETSEEVVPAGMKVRVLERESCVRARERALQVVP